MRVFPQITDPVVLFSYFSIVVEISVWSVLIFKTMETDFRAEPWKSCDGGR